MRNKSDPLLNQVKKNADVLVIPERKLGNIFPESQFKIPGFSPPFQEDRNQFDVGIVVFIKEDVPANFMFLEKTPLETIYLFNCT